jgi:hypothetical protein
LLSASHAELFGCAAADPLSATGESRIAEPCHYQSTHTNTLFSSRSTYLLFFVRDPDADLFPKPWDSAQGVAALPIDWPPLFVELLLHCKHPVTGLVIYLQNNKINNTGVAPAAVTAASAAAAMVVVCRGSDRKVCLLQGVDMLQLPMCGVGACNYAEVSSCKILFFSWQ